MNYFITLYTIYNLLAGELDLDLEDFESLLADRECDFDLDLETLLLVALLGRELLWEREREFLVLPFTVSGELERDLEHEREPLRLDTTDGDLDLWSPPTEEDFFNSSIPSRR